MVEIKLQSEEIAFRILVIGTRENAGVEGVRRLAAASSGAAAGLEVIHADGDRIQMLRYRSPDDGPLFDLDVSFQTVALADPLKASGNLKLLLRSADAVIILDDRGEGTDPDRIIADLAERWRDAEARHESTHVLVAAGDAVRSARWRAAAQTLGSQRHEVLECGIEGAFERARQRILGEFRTWENELERRGLEGHIKIRESIWEKIEIPWEGAPRAAGRTEESPTRDVRLVQQLPPRQRSARRLLVVAVVTTIIVVGLACFAHHFVTKL